MLHWCVVDFNSLFYQSCWKFVVDYSEMMLEFIREIAPHPQWGSYHFPIHSYFDFLSDPNEPCTLSLSNHFYQPKFEIALPICFHSAPISVILHRQSVLNGWWIFWISHEADPDHTSPWWIQLACLIWSKLTDLTCRDCFLFISIRVDVDLTLTISWVDLLCWALTPDTCPVWLQPEKSRGIKGPCSRAPQQW